MMVRPRSGTRLMRLLGAAGLAVIALVTTVALAADSPASADCARL